MFTDNGSKDLKLKTEILRLKKKKELEIYIVLTPDYEGRPNDESLRVFFLFGQGSVREREGAAAKQWCFVGIGSGDRLFRETVVLCSGIQYG